MAFNICAIYKLSYVKISKTGQSFNFFVGDSMPKMERNKKNMAEGSAASQARYS